MNRVKHLTMIILKVVFILLCFVLASAMTTLQNAPLARFDEMKGHTGAEGCEVLVLSEDDGSLEYDVVDGKIVFDIVQSGDRYDELEVVISYPAYKYDISPMRDYLYDTIGESAKREEGYLKAMEEGPWRTTYQFRLTGDAENDSNASYTLLTADDAEYTPSFKAGDNEFTKIEDLRIDKDEELSFILTFGSERGGALESGRYVFESDLAVNGLYEETASLSMLTTVNVLWKTCIQSVQENGLKIFTVNNWLSFYGAMIALGMFIYLWRDLRTMVKIFCAVTDSMGEGVHVIVHTYINGVYAGSRHEIQGGPSIFGALIVTVLAYMFFLLTIPIRILIYLVRDIVYLFVEDYDLDDFSYTGHILGSVGIYVLLFGIVGLLSASTVIGIICTIIGLVACIIASKLCSRNEV